MDRKARSDDYILLVEDDPNDQDLVRRVLRNAGLAGHLKIVGDGVEALTALEFGPLPKALFLDLKMPRKGGLETLQRIRATRKIRYLPVVVLTSSAEERDLERAFSLGANSYVRKPIEHSAYSSLIEALVRYWLEINERHSL